MIDIILQVDSLSTAASSAGKVESVWSLLGKGGPLMIPMGILFALAVFFFIERLLAINRAGKIDDNLMERMEVVDQHCKAFLVMDDSKTPDEREAHEKKIKKCLKSAGIKY